MVNTMLCELCLKKKNNNNIIVDVTISPYHHVLTPSGHNIFNVATLTFLVTQVVYFTIFLRDSKSFSRIVRTDSFAPNTYTNKTKCKLLSRVSKSCFSP